MPYRVRKMIGFVAVLWLLLSVAHGQNPDKIEAHFETDTIVALQGSTFMNFLKIKNTGEKEIFIQDLSPKENYAGLIFYPKTEVVLAPGEQKRLPVKFIADPEFLKQRFDEITFTFSQISVDAEKSLSASFYIQKKEERNMAVYTSSRENFIYPTDSESSVTLFVENRGYSERTVRLSFQSVPAGLEIFPAEQMLTLEGLERRKMELRISARKQGSLSPEYVIRVESTDTETLRPAGISNIPVVVLSHNIQVARAAGYIGGNNFAEFAYRQNSSGLNYLQMRGNTTFAAMKNLRTSINFAADTYHEQGLYNLYDTWLELGGEKASLRLGNVYGSDYDYSVSGRGGKIEAAFSDEREIEVLALENNYNLYGTYYPQTKGAIMTGGKYTFGASKPFSGRVSYLFDHDPRLSVATHVARFASVYRISDQSRFRWGAGLSDEKGLVHQDRHVGGSAVIDYENNTGNWDFQSLNSYKSKSYAGLGRGSFYLNQRIGYQLSRLKRIFVHYQNSQVEPEYLRFQGESRPGMDIYPDYFHSIHSVRTGYQFSFRNWNLLMAPQIEKQKSTINTVSHELLAYRFHTNLGTAFGSHGFNLTAEYAYAREDGQPDWFHGMRTNLSYRYRVFSVNGTVQWNPYNVTDLNSYYYVTGQDFLNYNLHTVWNFSALKRSLSGSVSAGINYTELYENLNQNLAGQFEYKISETWSATGYFNYSRYQSTLGEGFRGSYHQIQVGVKKYLGTMVSAGNHKISFVLFEDENFDGKLDPGETVLAGEVVRLDRYIAITDKNGRVTFRDVPKGIYKLKVSESTGSRLVMNPEIEVDRNRKMEVGLIKNIRVSGKLTEIRQKYDTEDANVVGIRIFAKDAAGKIYTTLADQNKEFEFFLKPGRYEVYIQNETYEFLEPSWKIEVERGVDPDILEFEYRKKGMNIKIKRF